MTHTSSATHPTRNGLPSDPGAILHKAPSGVIEMWGQNHLDWRPIRKGELQQTRQQKEANDAKSSQVPLVAGHSSSSGVEVWGCCIYLMPLSGRKQISRIRHVCASERASKVSVFLVSFGVAVKLQ